MSACILYHIYTIAVGPECVLASGRPVGIPNLREW